jgi:hypothetical protein
MPDLLKKVVGNDFEEMIQKKGGIGNYENGF